jgi:hypothetical protein
MKIYCWKACACNHRADWHTPGADLTYLEEQLDTCKFASCRCQKFRIKDNLEWLEFKYENSSNR